MFSRLHPPINNQPQPLFSFLALYLCSQLQLRRTGFTCRPYTLPSGRRTYLIDARINPSAGSLRGMWWQEQVLNQGSSWASDVCANAAWLRWGVPEVAVRKSCKERVIQPFTASKGKGENTSSTAGDVHLKSLSEATTSSIWATVFLKRKKAKAFSEEVFFSENSFRISRSMLTLYLFRWKRFVPVSRGDESQGTILRANNVG